MEIRFFVDGKPAPQGSKRAFKVGNRVNLVEMSKTLPEWRRRVTEAAKQAMGAKPPTVAPIALTVIFRLPKPAKPKWPIPATRPDLDKLLRSVNDAMTGIVYVDDSQIVTIVAEKRYATNFRTGCQILIENA